MMLSQFSLLACGIVLLVYHSIRSVFVGGQSAPCSHVLLGRLGSGVISSYNFPFDYRHNLTCVYSIDLSYIPVNSMAAVCLVFQRFSLESSSPFCSFDYLEIGVSPALKYCGLGLWNYGVVQQDNPISNVWSSQFCWNVSGGKDSSFDIKFISDNNINGTGFFARWNIYDVLPTHAALLSNTSNRQAPCRPEEWTCFNRNCVKQNQLCDGRGDCGDTSDESYAHARCAGLQGLMACDFSDYGTTSYVFCGFTSEGWQRTNKSLSMYAPTVDHTNVTDGYYIHTSSSNKNRSTLISKQHTIGIDMAYCFTFWYYIYGNPAIVSLHVYTTIAHTYTRPEWSRSAPTGGSWVQAEVYIPASLDGTLQIIFLADIGDSVSGVGLDDISLVAGKCAGADISCNFELGTCGWDVVNELSHRDGILHAESTWTTSSGLSSVFGPRTDRSSTDGGGYYLYTNATASVDGVSHSLVISPPVSITSPKHECLRLSAWMNGRTPNCCTLIVRAHKADDSLTGYLWSHDIKVHDNWTDVAIALNVDGAFQIVIEAVVRNEEQGEIAIDRLIVDDDIDCLVSPVFMTTIQAPFAIDEVCRSATHFRCVDTSVCIPLNWTCDLFDDCGDQSDESPAAGCLGFTPSTTLSTPEIIKCQSSDIFCIDTNNVSFCLPTTRRCNGVRDCSDGSDELNCTKAVPLNCVYPFKHCAVTGKCVHVHDSCNVTLTCSGQTLQDSVNVSCIGAPLSTSLGGGAIAGIVLSCVACLLLVILCALLCARHRNKSLDPASSPSSRFRSHSNISTIYHNQTMQNGVLHHPELLSSLHRLPLMSLPTMAPAYGRPNYNGYNVNESGITSIATAYLVQDMPPPYDSVIHERHGLPLNMYECREYTLPRETSRGYQMSGNGNATQNLPSVRSATSVLDKDLTEEHIYEDPLSLLRSASMGFGYGHPGRTYQTSNIGVTTSSPSGATSDCWSPAVSPASNDEWTEQPLVGMLAPNTTVGAKPASSELIDQQPNGPYRIATLFQDSPSTEFPSSFHNNNRMTLTAHRVPKIRLGTNSLHPRADRYDRKNRASGDFSFSTPCDDNYPISLISPRLFTEDTRVSDRQRRTHYASDVRDGIARGITVNESGKPVLTPDTYRMEPVDSKRRGHEPRRTRSNVTNFNGSSQQLAPISGRIVMRKQDYSNITPWQPQTPSSKDLKPIGSNSMKHYPRSDRPFQKIPHSNSTRFTVKPLFNIDSEVGYRGNDARRHVENQRAPGSPSYEYDSNSLSSTERMLESSVGDDCSRYANSEGHASANSHGDSSICPLVGTGDSGDCYSDKYFNPSCL